MRHPSLAAAVLGTFVLAVPVAPVVAQDAMPVEQLAATAQKLKAKLDRLAEIEKPSDAEKERIAATVQELSDLAEWIARQQGFTEQHYVEASSPFIQSHPKPALQITDAGLKLFPESRFLHDHRGFAQTKIAMDLHPCAARVKALQDAEAAFRKALTCKPETWHAHVGLFQVLDQLDKCDEALSELAIAEKDPAAKEGFVIPWQLRASVLMRAGKPKDAVKLLTTEKIEAADTVDQLVLLVRANALANDAAATQAAITKLRAADTTPRSLIEAADALAYLGKKPDALKLLAQRPPLGKWSSEQERIAQIWSQCGAAMEVFWNATDFSPTGPLRGALTKALDHSFMFMKDGKEANLSSSPLMMCKLLEGAAQNVSEHIKDWGNHTLFVLSARAAPAHKPDASEQFMIDSYAKNNDPIPGVDDIPARLLALRNNVGDPEAGGTLTGLRAIEKLEAKPPAAAPAPAPTKPPAKK